jgi:hypothetical protein
VRIYGQAPEEFGRIFGRKLGNVPCRTKKKEPVVTSFSIFGDEEIRTPDILLAKQALYQLSYVPAWPAFGAAARKSTPGPTTRDLDGAPKRKEGLLGTVGLAYGRTGAAAPLAEAHAR